MTNKVGSTSPRDLYENAKNLDYLLNGENPFYASRLGLLKQSWSGMQAEFRAAQNGRQAQFDAFLSASGYQNAGAYAAGVVLSTHNQYVTYNGQPYKLAGSTAVPYTTTGDWATESSKFVLLGDAPLRQDLSNSADSGKGAGLVSFSHSRTYPAGTLGAHARSVVSVRDLPFGAKGDGTTDDTAAMTAAESFSSSVYWPAGDYILTKAPKLGVSWGPARVFIGGVRAYLHPKPGPVEEIYAEIFGPPANTTADDQPALQRAVNFAQDNDLPLSLKPNATYRVNSDLIFKHGRNASDTKAYKVLLRGNGAKLYPSGKTTAIKVIPRCLLQDAETGRGLAEIEISDITIDGYLSPETPAITIGANGYHCDNLKWSLIKNVLITSFTSGQVFQIIEARHFHFERVAIRFGTFVLTSNTAGSFCGDSVFQTCEFNGNETTPPLLITAGAGTVASDTRGISFESCDIYGSGASINATGSAIVGDIWFDSCQFDGPSAPSGQRALIITASSSAQLSQIYIDECYFCNYTGPAIYGVTNGSSVVYMLSIKGGGTSLITGSTTYGNAAYYFNGCESVSIRDVEFDSIKGGQIIAIDGCTNVMIHDNKATRCSAVPYGVSIGNGNTHSIMANVMNVGTDVVNDFTSGNPTRQVVNNLKI